LRSGHYTSLTPSLTKDRRLLKKKRKEKRDPYKDTEFVEKKNHIFPDALPLPQRGTKNPSKRAQKGYKTQAQPNLPKVLSSDDRSFKAQATFLETVTRFNPP